MTPTKAEELVQLAQSYTVKQRETADSIAVLVGASWFATGESREELGSVTRRSISRSFACQVFLLEASNNDIIVAIMSSAEFAKMWSDAEFRELLADISQINEAKLQQLLETPINKSET